MNDDSAREVDNCCVGRGGACRNAGIETHRTRETAFQGPQARTGLNTSKSCSRKARLKLSEGLSISTSHLRTGKYPDESRYIYDMISQDWID